MVNFNSISYIDGAVDAVIAALNANCAQLGNFTRISERDEDPAVISTTGDMPIIVVIPLADRPDRVKYSMGMGGELQHDFSISIIGYHLYENLDPSSNLRQLRTYAFSALDLFRGAGSQVGSAFVYSATVDIGYYVMVDNPVYRWIVTLNLKMIEV
jgi:hypothetical protein